MPDSNRTVGLPLPKQTTCRRRPPTSSITPGGTYVPPGVMLDVGGRRLHVVCLGNGRPTVLFESGIAASSLSWTRVLRDVATFTRACAYDRAGLGWSDSSRAP